MAGSIIGIILICANATTTTCTVNKAHVILTTPKSYTDALSCQFGAVEYAAALHIIKPTDVVRIICHRGDFQALNPVT